LRGDPLVLKDRRPVLLPGSAGRRGLGV